jgi:SAM-dependent methyltransferase
LKKNFLNRIIVKRTFEIGFISIKVFLFRGQKMDSINCYNCGTDKHIFYAEENGYSLVKCVVCGLLYVKNPPNISQISQSQKYGEHRGSNKLNVTGKFNPGKIPIYKKIIDSQLNKHLENKKKWLDIGCGHGEFLLAVQKCSSGKITVKGTEPNIHKQKSAQKRGLDVGFFDIESHNFKYDIISILNVYSHLPDPPSFLKSIKKLLTPNGELFLETGDTAHLSSMDHYRPFYLPDHLSFASESIIVSILKRLNFKIISIKKYPYMRLSLRSISKELFKLILPQYQSRIRYLWKWPKYSQTDMFIFARLKS